MINVKIFVLFSSLLLAYHFLFCFTIDGLVIDSMKNQNIPFANVHLLDSMMVEKCGTATDVKGMFRFVNVTRGVYSIRVSLLGYSDTTYTPFKITGDTVLALNIYKYCKYDASLNNKTCPVCHKSDKVVPQKYGIITTEQKGK